MWRGSKLPHRACRDYIREGFGPLELSVKAVPPQRGAAFCRAKTPGNSIPGAIRIEGIDHGSAVFLKITHSTQAATIIPSHDSTAAFQPQALDNTPISPLVSAEPP